MNCLASIFKYIMYLANIIFLICGILLIVLGSLMLGKLGDVTSLPVLQEVINIDIIPIIIIVLGCIVFVVSFFGCCGAIRENACCMTTYAVFMFILFCLQVALVVWIFVKQKQFLNTMDTVVTTAWDNNNQGQGYPMDVLQVAFVCCGKNNFSDWTVSGQPVPISCCGTLSSTLNDITTQTCNADVYSVRPGCLKSFRDFWSSNTNIIRYAGIGVALVELIAFTLGFCLASAMRKR